MINTPSGDILVEQSDSLGIVTLNRPPHNFFSAELIKELQDIIQQLAAGDCRVVILKANGKSFCAGADFNGEGLSAEQAERLYTAAVGLFSLPLPIIAQIHGPAIGGGLGLSLLADFRIASPSARFSANFSKLGLHCGFGISATLPRVVGQQAAADLLFTGRRLKAEEAKDIGLVDKLVDDEALSDVTLDYAKEIASCAPIAVQSMRQTLLGERATLVQEAVKRELAEQTIQMKTEDFREGIAAYTERRPANFRGT